MSDLSEILSNRQLPNEPAEFQLIRDFVQEKLQVNPKLQIRDRSLIISVPSSAAAGSLQLLLPELRNKITTEYKLAVISN